MFDLEFATPELISRNSPDVVFIEMSHQYLITASNNTRLAIDFKPQEIKLPTQLANKMEAEAVEEVVTVI